ARGAATALVLLCVIAIRGTLQGLGPFVWGTANESLVLLQAFMGVTAVTTLILAAVVAERGRTARRLRLLSVTDALTGLANYRQLIGVLEAEIRRSQRTERPFAVLFFDVDGLKRINDRHGHLVGSRALCRMAEVLHVSCRAVDTAARFGGDEFAVVLPETDEAQARRVGERVLGRLTGDLERPRIAAKSAAPDVPAPLNFVAHLTGASEVPSHETPAVGEVKFQLSPDGTRLEYRLISSNIHNVIASHIHLAPAGVNGPITVFLFGNVPPGGGRTDGVLAHG